MTAFTPTAHCILCVGNVGRRIWYSI